MLTDFERLRVGEAFRSRKNRVFRITYDGDVRIAKVYPWANAKTAHEEYAVLSKAYKLGLRVPEPLELVGNTIVMTDLDGTVALDMLEQQSGHEEGISDKYGEMSLDELSCELADWLASFHSAFEFKVRRGDTVLRNFINARGQVYGVDFEESRKGDTLLDLGEMCASILSIRPFFSSRNTGFATNVISRYSKAVHRDRSADLPEAIALGLEHYAKYRKDRKTLETLAQSFRNEGLSLLEKPKSEQ